MVRADVTRRAILGALVDGVPLSLSGVRKVTGLGSSAVSLCLYRCWVDGFVLRSREVVRESGRVFKGRAGYGRNLRSYYLYVLAPEGVGDLMIDGVEFVGYDERFLDLRGRREGSKSRLVESYLRENMDRAFFSKQVAEALKDKGVKISDVMPAVRRLERRGVVYVRGYRTHDGETPFKNGYVITWLDENRPREEELANAIEKTNRALQDERSTNPVIHRVHQIKDVVFESSKLRELTSYTFLQNKLGCTKYQLETAIERALQLYPELHEIKQLGVFKYYYHQCLSQSDLEAAVKLNENYLKKTKGRANRVGHNWEAVPEWFIEKYVKSANFWTQQHRLDGMDPRRITIHLLRSVGDRRNNAEVDRVWEVTMSPFSQPLINVLSCKWGLVKKRDVDDFFNVLRWSKEFGADTPEGRRIRQGVIGVFAGSAFSGKFYFDSIN